MFTIINRKWQNIINRDFSRISRRTRKKIALNLVKIYFVCINILYNFIELVLVSKTQFKKDLLRFY